MNSDLRALSDVQSLINDFAQIHRHHFIAGTNDRESDTDHTLSVTMLAWQIMSSKKLPLDEAKVLKYALTHDLVEVHAGDVNTFASVKERETKAVREQEALEQIIKDHEEFPDMHIAIGAYEAREDDEALYVWTVDKMQALILGNLDNWRPYELLSISYDRFCDKFEELIPQSSPHISELFRSLFEYSKTVYYDRPKEKTPK